MEIEELIEDILKKFKILNHIEDEEIENEEGEVVKYNKYDELYKLYIEKAIREICILTNRNEFPIDLEYEVIDMLTDFYKINILSKDTSAENKGSDYIRNISEDGRSVSFDNSNELEFSSLISSNISNNLQLRMTRIYRYRLLYKVSCKDDK